MPARCGSLIRREFQSSTGESELCVAEFLTARFYAGAV